MAAQAMLSSMNAGSTAHAAHCQSPQASGGPALLHRGIRGPLTSLLGLQASRHQISRRRGNRLSCDARVQPFQEPILVDEDNPTVPKGDKRFKTSIPDLPTPGQYQQTLKHSFTIGGLGLHTAEYAFLRVRPAHAGEGRYFVRVPEGTNSHLYEIMGPEKKLDLDDVLRDPSLANDPVDMDEEDFQMQLFLEYLKAQDENDFKGSFNDFAEEEVEPKFARNTARLEAREPADEIVARSEQEPYVLATLGNVVDVDPIFVTLEQNGTRLQGWESLLSALDQMGVDNIEIEGVEHLLSALDQMGVDNARIEIEGGHEVPIVDGSALGWAIDIHAATLMRATQPEDEARTGRTPRHMPVVRQPLLVEGDGGAFMLFTPGDRRLLTAGVDHSEVAPIIGRQFYSWAPGDPGDDHFRWMVAPARGYAESTSALQTLRSKGYVKGGTADCCVIAFGERWYNNELVRFFDDEPCRHRLVDLTGDLSLLSQGGHGNMPSGHLVTFKADHALHHTFLRRLVDLMETPEGAQ